MRNINISRKTPAQLFTKELQRRKKEGVPKKIIKKEKRAIVTIFSDKDPEYVEIKEISLPRMELYAKSCNADMIVIEGQEDEVKELKSHIKDYFKKYNRILYIDLDVLIAKDSPNLFNMYPSKKLYAFDESEFFSITNKNKYFLNYIYQYNHFKREINEKTFSNKFLNNKYYHPGVFLCSEQTNPYRYSYLKFSPWDAFDVHNDSHFFNLMINVHNIDTQSLDKKFNFLPLNIPMEKRLNDAVPFPEQSDNYFFHLSGYTNNKLYRLKSTERHSLSFNER